MAPPPPPPLPGPPPELIEPGSALEEPTPYPSRPVRPVAQLAARVGLWTAVGFGCLGGLVGMFRPTGSDEPVVADSEVEGEVVPAPVAGVAEQAVEAWLLFSSDDGGGDEERLQRLYVEPPDTGEVFTDTLSLMDVTTVAGERMDEGYWSVTVAADVIEALPNAGADADGDGVPDGTSSDDGDGAGAGAGGGAADDVTEMSTWYVEVGIVGEVGKGLRALTTPGVLPAPPGVESPWRPVYSDTYTPEPDDDLASAAEGFLNALLAGNGDPSRYLAPHVDMRAADPAPFAELQIDEMAAEEGDDGEVRVWVQATATTRGEVVHVVAYELEVVERVDRWEVREIWGAPTVERNPEADGEGDGEAPAGSGSTGEGEGDQGTDDTSGTGEDGTTDDTSDPDEQGDATGGGETTDDTSGDAPTEGSTTSVGSDPMADTPPGE